MALAQNPNKLEDNVNNLIKEKKALILLKYKVERRGEAEKQGWLQKVEGKINEIEQTTKEAAEVKKGYGAARVTINKKVIQLTKDVIDLKERGKANPETVEKLLKEVTTASQRRFSSGDLVNFTSNFFRKIGSGAFGEIFSGEFPGGVKIAVKVLFEDIIKDNKYMTAELWTSEVKTTGKICHRHLIKLYGFCFEEQGKKALVYEYMENGSLDKILKGKEVGLEWDKLYGIAIETAMGLSHLHEGCDAQIIHHDIKPSNILLDSRFSPKITDFALAKYMNNDMTHRTISKTRGSVGYAAPEMWVPESHVTTKCDVYSYGMLLFDILKIGFNNTEKKWFPMQVWEKYCVGQLDEIIKECGISEKNRKEAETLSMVALWCVQDSPKKRPYMSNVVMMLKKNQVDRKPTYPFNTAAAPPVQQSLHGNNARGTKSVLESFDFKCPPGGENLVILYITRSPTSNFLQICSEVLSILRQYQVEVVERDYHSSGKTMMELSELLTPVLLPALFVKGRFIGGAIKVKEMAADGTLKLLFAETM